MKHNTRFSSLRHQKKAGYASGSTVHSVPFVKYKQLKSPFIGQLHLIPEFFVKTLQKNK